MKNETIKIIVNILKEIFSIIFVVIMVLFIVLSLGLGFIFLDSIHEKENEYDDWILMEEWKQKKEKEKLRMENKSINVSIWTPKIEKEENKK